MARLMQLCSVSTHPSGAELVCYISFTNLGCGVLCWTEQHLYVSLAAGGFKREYAIKAIADGRADAVVFGEWLQISTAGANSDDLFSL
jgi:hypothetical protein